MDHPLSGVAAKSKLGKADDTMLTPPAQSADKSRMIDLSKPWPFGLSRRRAPLFVRMNPLIRRNFLPFWQFDHAHRWGIPVLSAGPASERRFQLQDWRVTESADGIEREARAGFASDYIDL